MAHTPLTFRPHHVLCTLGFEGKGYSPAFVANYASIKKALTPTTRIQIRDGLDHICQACPHQRGDTCAKESLIQALDTRHRHALQLQNTCYPWQTLVNKVVTHIQPHHLDRLCQGCTWLALGVCKGAVQRLQAEKQDLQHAQPAQSSTPRSRHTPLRSRAVR